MKTNGLNEMPIGIIIPLENVLNNGIEELEELGLSICQLSCWDSKLYTQDNADKLKNILKDKIKIASLWVGWPPPAIWNFIDGPLTLGLVPREFRYLRMDCLKQGGDFASMLGVTDIVTHVGFIPENPATTEYREVVIAIREVAQHCKQKGIYFNFETGQETPITLKRTIEDVGLDNLGINLDPANLLLYGKANPVDAIDIYGTYIRSVHVKDGLYPTNSRELGQEMPVGQGMVNFPKLIKKLRSYGYDGPLIIEREISGPQQKVDVLKAKELLLSILKADMK